MAARAREIGEALVPRWRSLLDVPQTEGGGAALSSQSYAVFREGVRGSSRPDGSQHLIESQPMVLGVLCAWLTYPVASHSPLFAIPHTRGLAHVLRPKSPWLATASTCRLPVRGLFNPCRGSRHWTLPVALMPSRKRHAAGQQSALDASQWPTRVLACTLPAPSLAEGVSYAFHGDRQRLTKAAGSGQANVTAECFWPRFYCRPRRGQPRRHPFLPGSRGGDVTHRSRTVGPATLPGLSRAPHTRVVACGIGDG